MTAREIHDQAIAAALAGRPEDAVAPLAEALRRDPSDVRAARNLGIVLLGLGRYAEGAPLYEARIAAADSPGRAPPYPRWRGEPLAGRSVLIWPEQGAGDQIMFARFALELQRKGSDVTLVCLPSLERLLAENLPVRVRAARGAIEFPDPDVWLFSNSLLAASGATLETLPAQPYLRARESRPVPFRIGVVTRGNPAHLNDAHRSLPAELAEVLLAIPGAGSLAPEDTGAADFAETAAIVAGIDLVITVDTSMAHLAGAMGKPTWILLPDHQTDWRWLRGRTDSPWYPSARLFRQDASRRWEPVVEAVVRAAARLAQTRSASG